MNRNEDRLDILLDETCDRLRTTEADEATVERAASRVWGRVAEELSRADLRREESHRIRSCEDWQRLIPDYLAGRLPEARQILFEDHTRECVPCRRALKEARAGAGGARRATTRAERRSPGWRRDWTWGVAAAAIVAVALIGIGVRFGKLGVTSGGLVRVETVDGTLLKVADLLTTPAVAGEQYAADEPFRTGRESGAVMTLEDGSRIEMNERSELSVSRDGRGQTIHLQRGDIIVQAVDQGRGRLFVRTPDSKIEVSGTAFSVSAGTKGTRVSVLEGEVVVEDAEGRTVLGAGEQYASGSRILPVPVRQDVAWSRDADHWMAVAEEMDAFRRELDRRMGDVSRRFTSPLLDRVPNDTVVYVAVPNLSDVVQQAHDLLMEKVAASETFRSWWQDEVAATGADREIERAIGFVGRLGDALGEEIVVALEPGPDGAVRGPLVLAEVRDADAARGEFDGLVQGFSADAPGIRRVETPAAAVAEPGVEAWVWIGEDVLVLATEADALAPAAARATGTGATGFRGTPFGTALDAAYRDGVGLLVGADLQTMVRDGGLAHDDDAIAILGLTNIRHLIIERSDLGDVNLTRATLTVEGERQGVLSWLAEPAPMGALEFVSPDALAVSAFVIRQPAAVVNDLLDRLGDEGDEARRGLDEFRQQTGVDLLQDVAGVLGGEFAFALDGPVLPKPAWKVVIEVYDPAALQRTIEWGVEQFNAAADVDGRPGLTLTSSERRGRTYWAMTFDSVGLSMHYTFVDGYWLIASQDAMIDRALQYRASGVTLGASRKFLASLPEDGHDNVSAVMYQDLGRIVGAVLDGPVGQSLPQDKRDAVQSIAGREGPTTFVAYGERDRIQVVGVDRGSFLFGDQISKLFNVGALLDLGEVVDEIEPGTDEGDYDGRGPVGDASSTS